MDGTVQNTKQVKIFFDIIEKVYYDLGKIGNYIFRERSSVVWVWNLEIFY